MSTNQPLVLTEARGPLLIVTINRAAVRNAVDGPTASALANAFRLFEADDALKVAILTGVAFFTATGFDLAIMESQWRCCQAGGCREPSSQAYAVARGQPVAAMI